MTKAVRLEPQLFQSKSKMDVGDRMSRISAAKLHLLNLDPIRDRLGSRWPRLSALVHKLFESALREAQGPNDRFFATGELSYIVTFEGLSQEAAILACASVAKTVCGLLFGADEGEILVRSLVGQVPRLTQDLDTPDAEVLSDLLEQVGEEHITTENGVEPQCSGETRNWSQPPRGGWLSLARSRSARFGLDPVFLPMWDVQRGTSHSLSATLCSRRGEPTGNLARVLRANDPAELAELELSMLFAAAEYADQFQRCGAICAITAAVSHQTMACPQLRTQFVRALRGIPQFSCCPLLVRIDYIPAGIVAGRLAELVAALASTNSRVVLHFDHLSSVLRTGFRLGVAGLGADLQSGAADERFTSLLCEARDQRAFSYLTGINSSELARRAMTSGVRFLSGLALDGQRLTGNGPLPRLPLRMASTSPVHYVA